MNELQKLSDNLSYFINPWVSEIGENARIEDLRTEGVNDESSIEPERQEERPIEATHSDEEGQNTPRPILS